MVTCELGRWSAQDEVERVRAGLLVDCHVVCVGHEGGLFAPSVRILSYAATEHCDEVYVVSLQLSVTILVVSRRENVFTPRIWKRAEKTWCG